METVRFESEDNVRFESGDSGGLKAETVRFESGAVRFENEDSQV